MRLRRSMQRSAAVSLQSHTERRGYKTPLHTRITALLFCLLFVVSSIIPTYQAVASAATKDTKLPNALPVVDSKQTLATDAATPKGEKASSAALSGEALAGPQAKPSKPGSKHVEVASKRTLNTKTFDTGGGQFETRQYMGPVHFKNSEGKLQQIDTSLVEDANAADSSNLLGEAISWVKGKTQDISTYKVKANDWQARFASSSDKVGMVRIEADGKTISFSPRGAAQDITPVISKTAEGIELVRYPNLWKDVDVIYTVKNEMLKEEILLKSNTAATNFAFSINGANLKKNKNGGFDVEGVKQSLSELSVTLQKAGPTSEKVISQDFKNGVLSISLNKSWLNKQASNEFPVVIDPTWGRTGNISWNYTAYKSDGYVCYSNNCFTNAGTVYDNGWKSWRSVFYVDYSALQGKVLTESAMFLRQANRSYLVGFSGGHWYELSNANCFGYNCINWNRPRTSNWFDYQGEIDTYPIIKSAMDNGHWDQSFIINGEEGAGNSWKGFDPDISYMWFKYSTTPATPTVVSPQPDQTFVDPQVSFQVNPVGDADGDKVQYYFRIATGSDGETGTVINSGDLDSTQWTVPDGVLQDGTTYYLHAYTRDPFAYSAPSAPIKFKIDMRRGKDKTQTADTVGPVSIDLATGNVSTSISSHDTTALGGNLGVSLDYNSPLRTRNGLVGRYWNVNSQNYVPNPDTTAPSLTRVDKNVNFNWDQSSFSSGQNSDWFYGIWDGYFTAPVAGTYHFGGTNDDWFAVIVKDKLLYDNTCYSSTPCYNSASGSAAVNGIYLAAGEVVKIQAKYLEATGLAYARMYVKGPVAEQVVPTEWLSTGPRPLQQNTGLQGRYYYDDGSHNIDSTTKQLFLSRPEPALSFNWGTGSPIPNGAVDFMSRWEGYVTVPKTATYRFKTLADDGTKLRINGVDLSPAGSWNKCCSETQFNDITLEAGKPYQIVADHYDGGGPASYTLYVETTDASIAKKVVPNDWLSPNKQVLPAGWNLGIDPDGDLSYERLNATASSVVLSDSSGDTHAYTWTGGGYKPPVNEDGQLTRNNDGTFTLIDTDGKTYIFKADGQLDTVTLPTDDRKPAALKYSYVNGRIDTIADGIDGNRWAKVYYYDPTNSSGKCNANPGDGFDSLTTLTSGDRPKLYLCALETNDGRKTQFWYSQGNLARVAKIAPDSIGGMEATDYQYDQYGRITSIRDSLANDAVAASAATGRTADDSVLTQLTYDNLGRATAVKAPAATAGATRQEQTIEYLPYAMPFVRYVQQAAPWDHWVTTGNPPSGYRMEPTSMNVSLLNSPAEGTVALFSCMWGTDQMVSKDSNCEGATKLGLMGYIYTSPQTLISTTPIYRCYLLSNNYEHFMSMDSNCEGQTSEGIWGYAIAGNTVYGQTKQHITSDAEPNGFTRKIEWDGTFRTVRDTDVTGKATYQQWDAIKDLLLSTTDATGLKSTTIYDVNDLPTDSYGPAPFAWFGADRKPLAANVAQVPRTSTGYDENIVGPAVAYFNYKATNKSLLGAPKLHTTGINPNPAIFQRSWGTAIPITPDAGMDGWGLMATGKLTVPNTGNYTFRIWHDDGARLYVNDTLVIDDWNPGTNRAKDGTIALEANKPYRFKLDYFDADKNAVNLDVYMHYNGGPVTGDNNFGTQLKPDYNLGTSTKIYDSQAGDITTKIDYGSQPELSQVKQATANYVAGGTATDQNIASSLGYEPYQTGSLLRTTDKTLPGGNKYEYKYYDATFARSNPCIANSPSVSQAGRQKQTIEPDPDKNSATTDKPGINAPRVNEVVYDAVGRIVASKLNDDPWTCTTYDTRGRVTQVETPTIKGRYGRIVTNDYAYNGNPLVARQTDNVAGATTVTIDLLGRTVSSTDTFGYVTSNTYDDKGRLSQSVGPKGTEKLTYDNVNRVTDYLLDNVTYATITYDQYSRVANVVYPQSQTGGNKLTLSQIVRDTLQRNTGSTFTFSNGTTFNEAITLNQQRSYVTGYTNTLNGKTAGATYAYDKVGRMIGANVDGNQYAYSFAAQNASCTGLTGLNSLANRNSNRTSMTVNGTTTTYCYNNADQLISTTDTQVGVPVYDDHGNTMQLVGGGAPITFTYDALDANTKIQQGNNRVEYVKSASGSVLSKKEYRNNVLDKIYRYAAGVLITCDVANQTNCNVVDKYVSLPGGVALTIKASGNVYSIKNFHGDTALTVSAAGIPTSSVFLYDPFGQTAPSSTFGTGGYGGSSKDPSNSTNQSMAWAASPSRKAEAGDLFSIPIIQMGARVYLPTLGRFLQVDPIEGGTANAYVYVLDPINQSDYSGQFAIALFLAPIAIVAVAAVYFSPAATQTRNTVAKNMANTLTSAVSRVNAAISSIAKATPKAIASPLAPPKGCPTYSPAPGYTIVQPKTAAAALTNPTISAGVSGIQTSLSLGVKPYSRLIVRPGEWSTEPWASGNWYKYGLAPGPLNQMGKHYDFHYSVNEANCRYADIKEARTED